MKLFYVQDKRQIVGNCMLWWAEGDNGYTCEITKAKVFGETEARDLIRHDRSIKFAVWNKDFIDKHIISHVRIDMLHNNNQEQVILTP